MERPISFIQDYAPVGEKLTSWVRRPVSHCIVFASAHCSAEANGRQAPDETSINLNRNTTRDACSANQSCMAPALPFAGADPLLPPSQLALLFGASDPNRFRFSPLTPPPGSSPPTISIILALLLGVVTLFVGGGRCSVTTTHFLLVCYWLP